MQRIIVTVTQQCANDQK